MNLAINLVLTSKYCSNFNLKVKGEKLSPQCFPTFANYWLLNIMQFITTSSMFTN